MELAELISGAVQGVLGSVLGFVNTAGEQFTVRTVETSKNRSSLLTSSSIATSVAIVIVLLVVMVVLVKA